MDLRFAELEPTAAERSAVDEVVGPPSSAWEGGGPWNGDRQFARTGHDARGHRDLLLPALHALNDRVGWLSEGGLDYLCRRLDVPPAEAYGVATFYAMFTTTPRPPRVVHVCTDIACKANGADERCDELQRRVGPPGADAGGAVWQRSPCLGLCDRAPVALAFQAGERPRSHAAGPVTVDEVTSLLVDGLPADGAAEPEPVTAVPQAGDESLVLLRRVGRADSLDDYRAAGGYLALRRAVQLGPVGVLREVLDSKVLGRGGAAFPMGRKWDAVARQPDRPHYLVCNADESEPGTFKDRVLMEGDPFAVVEAMTIAAYATGCEHGYVYLRGEYPRAARRLQRAITECRARGLLGGRILGQEFAFDVEIRRGAGAYICGEETAIFNSIEGYRGEPRNKPPFPVEKGLFGRPTVVNNVETLVNVLPILTEGGPSFARTGTDSSTGTKLFCVSGTVRRPGLYEVPFGATLRDLLALAGGVPPGRSLRTVLLGGAAGSFVGPDRLDLPLTFEATRQANTTLGSGVVLVFDDSVDLVGVLLRIAAFFRDESCGQCVPCRVGTVRQEEALHRLAAARAAGPAVGTADRSATDLALLRDVGQAMRDASICGLGQTAWNAVESAIDRIGVFAGGNGDGGSDGARKEAARS